MEPSLVLQRERGQMNTCYAKSRTINTPDNSFSDFQNEIILENNGVQTKKQAWSMDFVPENETAIKL